MEEHVYKEMIKKIIDNGPNYTEQIKHDLKKIVDTGNSAEEILFFVELYFSAMNWM